MRRLGLYMIALLALGGRGQTLQAQAFTTIDETAYAWSYRPVYIFADSSHMALAEKQVLAFLKDRDALTDRNMALIVVTDSVDVHFGPQFQLSPQALRRRYNISDGGFTLVLVGKDTDEKFRAHEIIEPQIIYDRIDAMPMRLREMQLQKAGF